MPVSADEVAADARECIRTGANAIHLHVRSVSVVESLDAEDVARTLLAVLAVCPKAQIGITTGAWILPDTAQRLEAVTAWEVLPGFASVNFSEDGAPALAQLLLFTGVDVEAGLCDANAAEVFCKSGLVERCIRVLLEPQEQEMEAALQTVTEIERVWSRQRLRFLSAFLSRLHGSFTERKPLRGPCCMKRLLAATGCALDSRTHW